jgi:GTPase SAR1 family protein
MSDSTENRLLKLKQFIIDKYSEERNNPVINTSFRIEVPNNTVRELFNTDLKLALQQLNGWLLKEFPSRKNRVYIEDRSNTDVYIELS